MNESITSSKDVQRWKCGENTILKYPSEKTTMHSASYVHTKYPEAIITGFLNLHW